MALPAAVGWLTLAGGRLLGKVASPLIAGAMIWGLEQSTGAITWGIMSMLDTFLSVILVAFGDVDLPDAPSWDAIFPAAALDLVHLAGIFEALSIFLSALILRIILYLTTLGRF